MHNPKHPEGPRPSAMDEITMPRGRLHPISGWPLRDFGRLDHARPGFLWWTMRSRPLWRQAVFAVVAKGVLDDPAPFLRHAYGEINDSLSWSTLLAEFASALQVMKPRDLIDAAFGACPDGLLGALTKLHFEAMPSPEAYGRLFELFASTDPEARKRKRVVEQLARFDQDKLEVVEALELRLLTPTVVSRLDGKADAEALNRKAAAARRLCSTVTDDAIRTAIETDEGRWGLCWFGRLIGKKADRLLPEALPTDGDAEFERVTPAAAKRVGHEFENCLGDGGLTKRMLSGTFALVAWRGAKLLIEMTQLDGGGWVVTGLHAHANERVTRELMEKVAGRLVPLGVQVLLPAKRPIELDVVHEAMGAWDNPVFDLFAGLDDAED